MNIRLTRYLIAFGLLVALATFARPAIHPQHDTPKKELVNITVSGVTEEAILKNIHSALANIKSAHLTQPITDDSIYSIYDTAPKGIKNAMQPYGYFNPTIKSSYANVHGIWDMHFSITPGPRSTVTDVNIKVLGQGARDARFLKVITRYPLKHGDFFDLKKYNTGNTLIFEHAANLGYFNASMTINKITVNLLNHTVKVDIELDTGPRHHFGFTHFSKTPFNIKFLNKFLAYKQGDYYSNNKVLKTQSNLSNSNYFSQVVVSPLIKQSLHEVTPMDILLQMRKRKEYTFGLGYGTDTQVRGTAGFKYRWVNSWGHYFDTLLQASLVNNSLVGSYNIPWPNPNKDLLSLRVGAGNLNLNSGTSVGGKASVQYRHIYTDWTNTFSFSYLNEHYDMTNLPRTRASLFYPDASASYYSTKNHINPDNALRFTTDVAGTPSWMSSTSGFSQVKAESKAIVTLFHYEQIAARFAMGRTQIHSINNLPMSMQFLIGGSQTVRGYDYQGIGPGRNMTYGSIEFRQRIWNQLFVAGFYDFGTVTDTGMFSDMRKSAGPSILYRSPIGVIQASVAWRLITHDIKPRFVFNIGPEI